MAGETVASARSVKPLNGIREVGGPQQFGLDDLVRKGLAAKGDPRQVVTDEQAHSLAKNLRLKIEQELDYPSTIKVTVIREQRYTETAT